MRRSAVLAAAAGLLALLPGTAASAASPTATKAPAFTCNQDKVTATDSEGSTVPAARQAGYKLDDTLRVHNVESATLANAYYTFTLDDPYKLHGGTPTVWWRIGSGGWRLMTLHWANQTASTSQPGWQSPNLGLGTIPARGTIAVEVSLSFPAHSIKGAYFDMFRFGSNACGASFPSLGWFQSSGFEYWPWKGLEGSPE